MTNPNDGSIDFDATAVAPSTGTPDPVPVGPYTLAVTQIEKKTNDNGWSVKTEISVLEGDYKGRKMWENYNIQHSNSEAQRIGQEQFSGLCHATGILKPRQLSELLNIPFKAQVRIAPAKNGYDPQNKIAKYLNRDGSKLTAIAGGAPAAPAAKRPSVTPPPFARKAS